MASTSSHLHIIGRLGQDPELRYIKDGQAVTNLSLAVDQGYGDKQAEAANNWLSKGDLISVTSESFWINAYVVQDGSIRGQLEVTARRADYLITKRNPNEAPTPDADETVSF